MPCARRRLGARDGAAGRQRIPAGVVGAPLQPGTAARIFTGAQVPPGADAVVMQESALPAMAACASTRRAGGNGSAAAARTSRRRTVLPPAAG